MSEQLSNAEAASTSGGYSLSCELAAVLGRKLIRRAREDRRLSADLLRVPAKHRRELLARCHSENAQALKQIVERHGWPTRALVGDEACTAALTILLHAGDLRFQLHCGHLIDDATEAGHCSGVHRAYIQDHCEAQQGNPQTYGTCINTVLGRPYPIRDEATVDARRASIGLRPLEQQMQALRAASLPTLKELRP
ncbi:DUF6624 domain-containing protein [Streptomyces sp. NPDC002055]|uniref:DUF6624 domain-containing protein n=1 Tax=Streptomyces sp. NPDC002055 TaxID=3154534 RepID=UPI00332CB51A